MKLLILPLSQRPKLIRSVSCLLRVFIPLAVHSQVSLHVCYNINCLLLFFYQGSLSGPRNVVHCCHPTPEAPLHFQKQEHLCAPMSPSAAFSSGCEVWNTCHCFHSCVATTHFHACYWWQRELNSRCFCRCFDIVSSKRLERVFNWPYL